MQTWPQLQLTNLMSLCHLTHALFIDWINLDQQVIAQQAADHAAASPYEELCIYLEAPLKQVENVVAWWGALIV